MFLGFHKSFSHFLCSYTMYNEDFSYKILSLLKKKKTQVQRFSRLLLAIHIYTDGHIYRLQYFIKDLSQYNKIILAIKY